jgi:hypothetical protein
MSCTASGEGLVAGLAWTEGAAAEEEAEEGIVEGWRLEAGRVEAVGFCGRAGRGRLHLSAEGPVLYIQHIYPCTELDCMHVYPDL